MTNLEIVNQFLEEAKVFDFITVDGDKPKCRPFSFHMMDNGRIVFGTGTFKPTYQQIVNNPHVEVYAMYDGKFLRYDGEVEFLDEPDLKDKATKLMPQVMQMYETNGWTMVFNILKNAHAEIHTVSTIEQEFDL